MTEPSDVIAADVFPVQNRFSIAARFRSFTYAWRGLRRLVQYEHNARLHLAGSLAVVAAGLFLKVSANDWRWLILAMALVWLAEAFNTAIEELCDRVEPGLDRAYQGHRGRCGSHRFHGGGRDRSSDAWAAYSGPVGVRVEPLCLTLPPFSG